MSYICILASWHSQARACVHTHKTHAHVKTTSTVCVWKDIVRLLICKNIKFKSKDHFTEDSVLLEGLVGEVHTRFGEYLSVYGRSRQAVQNVGLF